MTAPAPFDMLPLFVRAGSIIPMTKPCTSLAENQAGRLFSTFIRKKTAGDLYEDDGESFNYERGAYSLTHFSWSDDRLKVDKQKTALQISGEEVSNYRREINGLSLM